MLSWHNGWASNRSLVLVASYLVSVQVPGPTRPRCVKLYTRIKCVRSESRAYFCKMPSAAIFAQVQAKYSLFCSGSFSFSLGFWKHQYTSYPFTNVLKHLCCHNLVTGVCPSHLFQCSGLQRGSCKIFIISGHYTFSKPCCHFPDLEEKLCVFSTVLICKIPLWPTNKSHRAPSCTDFSPTYHRFYGGKKEWASTK